MTESKEDMIKMMTRRLAKKDVSDKQIAALADNVLNSKHKFVAFDPCILGICIDIEWGGSLGDLDLTSIIEELPGRFHGIDIRQKGIFPNERHFNLSITQDM